MVRGRSFGVRNIGIRHIGIRGAEVRWWLLAGVVACTSAFVLGRAALSVQRREAALGERTVVVVARRDLPLGTVVRPGDVAARVVHGDLTGRGALRDARRAAGRTVRVPVLAGAVVTRRHLAPPGRTGAAALLPADRRAVRIEVPGAPRPRPGDVVDLLVAAEEGRPSARLVLEGVLVLAVDTGHHEGVGPTVGVVLQVTPAEARRLAAAVTRGVPVLVLAPPEAARP